MKIQESRNLKQQVDATICKFESLKIFSDYGQKT